MGAGGYRFLPTLAFAWSSYGASGGDCQSARRLGCPFVHHVLWVAVHWRHPAFRDMHFAEEAGRFQAAPAGTAVTIPESTRGWEMTL